MGVSIKYVHEKKPLGTAGALGLLSKCITKENNLPAYSARKYCAVIIFALVSALEIR